MNIKVLKKSRNELKIEIEGEGHTFCNLLQGALLEDKNVEIAGYDLPHPLVAKPVLYLRMRKDASPEKALERALTRIKQSAEEFLEKLQGASVQTS